MQRRSRLGAWVLTGFTMLVFTFLMLPLLVVFPISVSSASYMQFPPPGFSWQWYQRYFGDEIWIEATIRSFQVAALCTVLAMLLGVPLAFLLVRSKRRGIWMLDRLAAAPIIVPTIILSIAIYSIFARLQLIGVWYGVAIAHTVLALPFVVILVGAGLRGFDPAQEQAAMGLGASWPVAIWRITLPQLRPSLISAAFLAFISSFDELVVAMFLSGAAMTLPKKMFDNIMMEIDPTIAAVSVTQILLVGICLGLTAIFGRGALATTMSR
ncbi:ABC transporter permease [Sediminicoccus sp. KRV36]|uniref:ABC transporter permease n=1 Tax=Sediminicoccus sp. KRV36 TaxID=3133721 RepID=UPI002010011B|nr:ABC transporter permease [Sediminicoccus rosea]UPY36738.1 ABC transporter permease [Sediminicoccus rosea]